MSTAAHDELRLQVLCLLIALGLSTGSCGGLPQAERRDDPAKAARDANEATKPREPAGDALGEAGGGDHGGHDAVTHTDGVGSEQTEPSSSDPQPAGPPLAAPIPGCAPAPLEPTGDFGADCGTRINQLRRECQNLPPLLHDEAGESCADMHAAAAARTGNPHGAFSLGLCFRGRAQNECPGWSGEPHDVMSTCLQIMWDEGPGPFWEGHGHYVNMTNPDHSRVACGIAVTSDGAVWSVQNFM